MRPALLLALSVCLFHDFLCFATYECFHPCLGQSKRFGELRVQLFDHQEAPTYVVRKFDVAHDSVPESRVIVQIQYIMWPDRYTVDFDMVLYWRIAAHRSWGVYNYFEGVHHHNPKKNLP